MKSISSQVILVTGATDGLGKALSRQLAEMNASVILHGRDPVKGAAVLDEIKDSTGNDKLVYYNADFASLDDVRQLADKILSSHQQLDLLVNNAGIGGGPKHSGRQVSSDGYELRFAVNYLAPFLLTHQLLPLLIKSEPVRIINVASGAQHPLDFKDLMLEKGYSGHRAYAQSKLALIMFTFSLAEKLKDHAICVNCLHPASMMNTKMVVESGGIPETSVSEGVDSILFVAADPETEKQCGLYFNRRHAEMADPQAYDDEARDTLYQLSTELAGL